MEGSTFRLTDSDKGNDIHALQTHFAQVRRNPRSVMTISFGSLSKSPVAQELHDFTAECVRKLKQKAVA
jgi:hypothetical protein